MNLERYPRVAFFADGIEETKRRLNSFTREHELPLLIVRRDATTTLDRLLRHSKIKTSLEDFRPDVIHAAHPGELGLMGTYFARILQVPLVLSWHANLPAQGLIDQMLLAGLYRFPWLAQVLLAPNASIGSVLQDNTGLPTHLIPPAVDSNLFAPLKRVYADGVMRIGYAGPLSSENNVRCLARLERYLRAKVTRPFRFLIVGEGSERSWLEGNLEDAEFTGDLEDERLARAIARMDIFVFPSETDVSGEGVLRAMASGVPVVVTSKGGPRFLVEDGVSGFVARSRLDFDRHVLMLVTNPELRRRMGHAARSSADKWSWDVMCEALYRAYRLGIRSFPARPTHSPMRPPTPVGLHPTI